MTKNGTARLPKDAFIMVTYRCNARCVMCDNWRRSPGDEMKPDDFVRLPGSITYINVSGGEPFMREDLPDIVRVLHKTYGAKMDISTNGIMTARIEWQMKEILKIGAKVGVRVSIDGIGEVHNRVRGTKNAFDSALATVRLLKDMGLKDLGIGVLATNHNLDQMRAVVDLAKKLDVEFTCGGVAQNSATTFSVDKNGPIENLDELKRQLDYIAAEHLKTLNPRNWVRAYIDSGLYHFAASRERKFPCFAGTDMVFVTPCGGVYPCPVLDVTLGNLMEQPFEEIWNSEVASAFRCNMRDVHRCPNPCWMICTVFPHMRQHLLGSAAWMIENKVRAHLRLPLRPSQ